MPDEKSQLERWLDIDQPAPDLRAEIEAGREKAMEQINADTAKFQGMSHDQIVDELHANAGKLADAMANAPAPEQARDEVDVFKSAMGDTMRDYHDGKIDEEQLADVLVETFQPIADAEAPLTDDIDALQDRIDDARAQLTELRDEARARGETEASPEDVAKVFDFVQSGLEVVEAQIDTASDFNDAMHAGVEGLIDARADLPTADEARIEAQHAAAERTHDKDVQVIEGIRDDYAAMHEKIDVLSDHIRDGDIPINATPEQVHAVVDQEMHEIDAAHQPAPADAE